MKNNSPTGLPERLENAHFSAPTGRLRDEIKRRYNLHEGAISVIYEFVKSPYQKRTVDDAKKWFADLLASRESDSAIAADEKEK
jgi:hypothetical protein